MSKKAIAPKIDEASAEWYSLTFQSLNAGTTCILEAFPTMYRIAMLEMKGQFTRGELGMILDVLNGHGVLLEHTGVIGQSLLLNIRDSFDLYPGMYEEKWEVTKDFITKLEGLTRFQKVCLEIWAAAFWEQLENLDIEEYIKAQC